MGLRFYRRMSIVPGLRLNASMSGLSVSLGTRGAWYTIGPHSHRVSVGVPGTGVYWTETAAAPPHSGHRLLFILALAAAALLAHLGGLA